jgi:hypothetical protein
MAKKKTKAVKKPILKNIELEIVNKVTTYYKSKK